MPESKKGRPATYRDLRRTLSRILPRESFDMLLEQMGAVERIASLWAINHLWQRREYVRKGAGEPPTPEDFDRLRAGEDHIKQRLRDRLYYAAVLAVMEAEPAGLGQDVPVSYVESCEKVTAILGRKNEWLPKQGRKKGARAKRTTAADADQEETRRNQVLEAIGELSRELPELDRITRKAVAQKIGMDRKTLGRWIKMYGWDWDVMELEGARGHGKEK